MLIGRKCQTHNDCMAACLRTLLNDDNVPHLVDGIRKPIEVWEGLRDYMKAKGKFLALFAHDDPLNFMQEVNPDIAYMLLCSNAVGDHALICKGDQVIHDPACQYMPILGVNSIGTYIVGIVGDLN